MAERITVTELNARAKDLLTGAPFLKDIWVVGEISNFKTYTSGHSYFTIKDSGGAISSVMFRYARSRLDFQPADAMKIEAYGHVDLYEKTGSYQFIVESMKVSGIGDLYLKYEELKKKLEAEGLFDSSKKRKIPKYPKTIGVVTSPTGAVIHDILTTTKRLYPVDILLAPSAVQGEAAAKEIVAGIELLNRQNVDVIIVGRGGGSLEDLWPFNEEIVVRAIRNSKVPVISSVGHETDFTLSDFAADLRAATPTAAAEQAVRDSKEIKDELTQYTVRMNKALTTVTERMRGRFVFLDGKLDPRRAREMVERLGMELDNCEMRSKAAVEGSVSEMHRRFVLIQNSPEPALRQIVASKRSDAGYLFQRMDPAVTGIIRRKQSQEETVSAKVDALSPYSVLDRGYSFVAGPDGRALTSVKSIEVGSKVTIRMRDGKAEAAVTDKEEFE
ncbi:exodeoxyribonuclease VII, large subunit [Thermoplasmatales archaeon BRNA1]|nr:exodeoxyribonuclease VII, large subunit [Thermoplasmatales archaeon BRNA1]